MFMYNNKKNMCRSLVYEEDIEEKKLLLNEKDEEINILFPEIFFTLTRSIFCHSQTHNNTNFLSFSPNKSLAYTNHVSNNKYCACTTNNTHTHTDQILNQTQG